MTDRKTIAIDVQTTLAEKTGFGFYVSNLVSELAQTDHIFRYVPLAPATNREFYSVRRFLWDQLEVPLRAVQAHADLVHQPAFSAPVLFPGKIVVTVHDLIARLFGQDIKFGSRQYFAHWMPMSYRRADHIIAVSEHTRRDLIHELKLDPAKITVIYEAAGQEFRPLSDQPLITAVVKKYQIQTPYIIHIGTINPRKNLEFMVRVFAEIGKRDRSISLVITGKKGWYYDGLFALVRELGLEDRVIFTGYVDDADKPSLYNGAVACVFPSLYEGFGLPPLEAMACGTPVIASNSSSIPEVVGEAGILLDPRDQAGWVRALSRLLGDARLRTKLRSAGLKQARTFSWQKTAEQTIAIYRKVLGVDQ